MAQSTLNFWIELTLLPPARVLFGPDGPVCHDEDKIVRLQVVHGFTIAVIERLEPFRMQSLQVLTQTVFFVLRYGRERQQKDEEDEYRRSHWHLPTSK